MRGQPAMSNKDFFPAAPMSCKKCFKLPAETVPFNMCGRCRSVRYCTVDCQQADWVAHKPECKERAKLRSQKLDSDFGIACFRGDEAEVTNLLAAGANCNCLNPMTKASAIMGPAQRGHIGVIRLLVKAGANTNYATSTGENALNLAASKGHSAICTLLVEEGGAAVDGMDSDGNTPLITAALMGLAGTVRELLRLGANPRHKASGNVTALSVATRGGHRECADILRAALV